MLIRQIFGNGKRCISTCSSMPRRNIQSVEDAKVVESKTTLPEHNKKLKQRPPFLKNLFIGRFDTEFLTFLEPQTDERYKQFLEWMKPIDNYMTSVTNMIDNQVVRGEAFRKLKELDILRARIEGKYNGLSMSQVETLKLLESLASMPWLATCIIKNNIVPVDIISKYGNEAQKRKYLPKIGNGDLLPTICITEVSSGPNIQNIKTIATLSECGNFWTLNGKKIFVANGKDSNLFLVIAHCANDRMIQCDSLSAFLVESSYGGITCSDDINTVGQSEVHVCTVDFKDTRVPKENVLCQDGKGVNILVDVFAPGNNRVAGEAIGILRNFLYLLNKNILGRKHLDRSMHEFEAVEDIVTNITKSLYCMESVAYFTSAIHDVFENQDLELERAVVETYCANECVEQIYKGLQVIGAEAYLKDNPYIKLYEDALGLSIYDGSVIDEKIYIALLGLQYTGKNIADHVYKIRNHIFHPGYFFKNLLFDGKPTKFHLFEYLHPSFQPQAETLEELVFKLSELSLKLLEMYGNEISSKQIALQRLAYIAIDIYVLIAVLARASRSYCIGVRNADNERFITMSIVHDTYKRVEMFEKDIYETEHRKKDSITHIISQEIFKEKRYIYENPLTRTF